MPDKSNAYQHDRRAEIISSSENPADEAALIVVVIRFDRRSNTLQVTVEKTKTENQPRNL